MFRNVLKVADNQQVYHTIFADEAIKGFSMLDLTIDSIGKYGGQLG